MRALMVVVGVACLTACGGSSASSSSSTISLTISSTASSPAQGSTGSGSQAGTPQACSVVTQAEAATALGGSVTQQGGGSTCIWTNSGGKGLDVSVFHVGASAPAAVQGQPCSGTKSPLSGIGDAAVYCSSSPQTINVAKNGNFASLKCSSCGKDGLVAAARQAAGRL